MEKNFLDGANSTVLITNTVDPILKDVKILLRDISKQMVAAWEHVFKTEVPVFDDKYKDLIISNFEISTEGDIFNKDNSFEADAVVSPANSFGFMDGGIDWRYSERFGWQLMERLQQVIKGEDYFGELLVGQAIILETNDEMKKIPYLISAPTMRVPLDVSNSPNAYLAFKATLMEVRKHNKMVSSNLKKGTLIKSILCPGLGTAVGRMPALTCAMQMLKAYETVVLGRVFPHNRLRAYVHEHHNICKEYKEKEIKSGGTGIVSLFSKMLNIGGSEQQKSKKESPPQNKSSEPVVPSAAAGSEKPSEAVPTAPAEKSQPSESVVTIPEKSQASEVVTTAPAEKPQTSEAAPTLDATESLPTTTPSEKSQTSEVESTAVDEKPQTSEAMNEKPQATESVPTTTSEKPQTSEAVSTAPDEKPQIDSVSVVHDADSDSTNSETKM